MNKETKLIKKKLLKENSLRDCLILSNSIEVQAKENSEWIGFVQIIKSLLKNESLEIKHDMNVEKQRQELIMQRMLSQQQTSQELSDRMTLISKEIEKSVDKTIEKSVEKIIEQSIERKLLTSADAPR